MSRDSHVPWFKRDDRAHSFRGSGNSNLGCAYQEAEVSEPPPRRVRRALTAALFCGAKEGHVWRKAKSDWDADCWRHIREAADGPADARAGRREHAFVRQHSMASHAG